MKILVTGAAGFAASHLVKALNELEGITLRLLIRDSNTRNMRRLTDPALGNLEWQIQNGYIEIIKGDLTADINGLCEGVDVVFHAAALTFVDRAILSPESFIHNNIYGTWNLLEDARKYKVKRFIFYSTDEVLGQILEGSYSEDAPPNPRNVYAASKLSGEALCKAYAHTYGLNTLITRSENIYGPAQAPQKAIPTFVRALLSKQPVPVYGNGQHVRQWIHVSDHVRAMIHLMNLDTTPSDIYNIAGHQELTNLELAKLVVIAFDPGIDEPEQKIQFIDDSKLRPGHDLRYSLAIAKLQATGWKPKMHLEAGISHTVQWFINHPWWLR